MRREPSVPTKTGLLQRGHDTRFEEGGSVFEAEEGACWVCSRSMIPHPSHACRSCRAGKPDEWVATAPVAVERPAPVLETLAGIAGHDLGRVCDCGCGAKLYGWRETRRYASVECRNRDQKKRDEVRRAEMGGGVENTEPLKALDCVCGRSFKRPAAFGSHKRHCAAARGDTPKLSTPPPRKLSPPASAEEGGPVRDDDRELAALSACVRVLAELPPPIRRVTLEYLQAKFSPAEAV